MVLCMHEGTQALSKKWASSAQHCEMWTFRTHPFSGSEGWKGWAVRTTPATDGGGSWGTWLWNFDQLLVWDVGRLTGLIFRSGEPSRGAAGYPGYCVCLWDCATMLCMQIGINYNFDWRGWRAHTGSRKVPPSRGAKASSC